MIGETRTKMGEVGERLRERRVEGRIDDLDRENVRLRTEVSQLRSDLDHERSLLRTALGRRSRPTVVKKRRGGIVRTALVGGGAYVLGTRAGRERYDQLVEWFGRARSKALGDGDGFASAMDGPQPDDGSDREDASGGPEGSYAGSMGSMAEGDRVAT